MAIGRAKYSIMCVESGGVIDDMVVYRLDAERCLVVANASNHPVVLTQLRRRAAAFETSVVDRSNTHALVAVQGPSSLEISSRSPKLPWSH